MKRLVDSRIVSLEISSDLAYPGYVQTQLPPDYIELEKRVDAFKQAHQKMLQVTCVQTFPAYLRTFR